MFARDMIIATNAEAYGLRDHRARSTTDGADAPRIPGTAAALPLSSPAVNPYAQQVAVGKNPRSGSGQGVPRRGDGTGIAGIPGRLEGAAGRAGGAACARASTSPGAIVSGFVVLAILAVVALATAIDVSTQAEGRVALGVTAATLLTAITSLY